MYANVLLQKCLFRLFWDFQVRYSDFLTCHDEQEQKPRLIQPTEVRLSPDLSGHPSTLIKPRPSCPRLHTHFSSTPSQVPASVSQRVTTGAHTPESLSRVPGGISGACSSITLGSDKHTHVSRCIFSALPVSAGPSNHL